jgi:hypothetical protein
MVSPAEHSGYQTWRWHNCNNEGSFVIDHLPSSIRRDYDAFRRDLQRHGARYTLEKTAKLLYWRVHPTNRRYVQVLERERPLEEAYDRDHNVRTSGLVDLADAGVDYRDLDRMNRIYRPMFAARFHQLIQRLNIDYSQFTFIDYGSGRGKVLFLASDYPFKRIIGVEYSPVLHEEATQNIESFRSDTQRCDTIESIHADAMAYQPPDDPLICFFNRPFDEATLTQVLSNLHQSLQQVSRPIYVIYFSVRRIRLYDPVFAQFPFLRVLGRGADHRILRAGPPTSVHTPA